MDAYASDRRSMGGEPNKALGENWKSALCVTSLYDSYVALQHENDALKDQVRQLQHANELLSLANNNNNNSARHTKQRRPELESTNDPAVGAGVVATDDSVVDLDDDALVQEIRLLRTEKLQQELLFDKRHAQLEAVADKYKALYAEIQAKYEQKCELDPLAPQRVAASTRALQHALDQSVLEKEELVTKHTKLLALYQQLDADYNLAKIQQADNVVRRYAQALRLVRNVVERRVFARVGHAWRQWRLVALSERVRMHQVEDATNQQLRADALRTATTKDRAAKFWRKLVRSSATRCLIAWRLWANAKRRQRQLLESGQNVIKRKVELTVLKAWREHVWGSQAINVGGWKLAKLLNRHSARRAWGKWSRFSRRVQFSQQRREIEALEAEIARSEAHVSELALTVEAVEADRGALAIQLQQTAVVHAARVQASDQCADDSQQRVGDVLFRRFQRLIVRDSFRGWRRVAETQRFLHHKITTFQLGRQARAVSKMVIHWHIVAYEQRRLMQITRQVVQRRGLLEAHRCISAWRVFATVRRARTATLMRAVHHMRHRPMVHCFRQWAQNHNERRHFRQRLMKMGGTINRFQLGQAFSVWKKFSTELSVAAEQLSLQRIETEWRRQLEQSKGEIKILRGYFQIWQRTTRSDKRARQLTSKYAIKWKHGMQAKCLDVWKAMAVQGRAARGLFRRLTVRWGTRELQNTWTRWRMQTLVQAKDERIQAVKRERDARVLQLEEELLALRREDVATKATSAEREQQLVEELQAMQCTVANARGSCTQYKTRLTRVYLTLNQKRIRRQCLRAWHDAVREAICRERLVTSLTWRKRVEVLRRVFVAWHKLCHERKRILLSTTHLQRLWDRQVLGGCYDAWVVYGTRQRTARKATETFAASSTRRLCHTVFTKWHSETRKTRLLRRMLGQIWLRSVHVHMRECLARWSERTREAKLQHELSQRQLSLDAIRVRWTANVLKTALLAWRQSVEIRKRWSAGVQRLRRFHDQWLSVTAFKAWEAFHGKIRAQRLWLANWAIRRAQKATVVSWHEWKVVTICRRREKTVAMQETCHQYELALAVKQHEITELLGKHQELSMQVETLQKENGDVGVSASHLVQKLVCSKCFYHWRVVSRSRRFQKTQLCRFTKNHSNRIQKLLLHRWAAVVKTQREKQQLAEQLLTTRCHRRLRHLFCKWRSLTQRQMTATRLVGRLRSRRDRQTQAFVLRAWTAFVRRRSGAEHLLIVLDRTLPKLMRRKAFSVWTHKTQCERQRQIQRTERQRRVVAFMVDKHTDLLTRVFDAWRKLGAAHHTRMETAQRLWQRTRQRQLQELLTAWRAHIHWQRHCSRSAALVLQIVGRHRRRVAFHHWRRQDTRCRLDTLEYERQQLDHKQQLAQRERGVACAEATQLRAAVQSLEMSQAQMRDTMAAKDATYLAQVHHTRRQLVLANLLTRAHCTPRSRTVIGAALHHWRRRTKTLSDRLAALRRCGHLLTRKLIARSFCLWRRRAAQSMRLDDAIERRRIVRCRRVLTAWTHFVWDQTTRRRQFLLRWIAATHARQLHANLEKMTALAFRVWRLFTANASGRETLRMASTAMELDHAQQRKRLLLAKWCWRAYYTRCQRLRRGWTQWRSALAQEAMEHLQVTVQTRETARAQDIEKAQLRLEETVVQRMSQGLQTLFRRLSTAASCAELFNAVTSSISHVSCGNASGVLYLLDPASHQLWTERRDSPQIVQAPASVGLAGAAIASMATLLTENATSDARFHPLVDQLVIAGLGTVSSGVDLFTTAIVGVDGTALGVLQIALEVSRGGEETVQSTRTFVRLLGHACGFFVEQLVYEMVRHARDRVRVRSPQRFTKLFKQNKQWRKYFVQVEREAQKTAQHLHQLLAEQDLLVEDRARFNEAFAELERERRALAEERDHRQQQDEKQELLMRHLVAAKKKTAKLKELLQEKEQRLSESARELDRVVQDHATYRQETQSREWQALLTTTKAKKRGAKEDEVQEDESFSHQKLLLQGADVAALKNQLVRAESDSLLLVNAVDVATRHHGDLPETLKMEVNRISIRLKKKSTHA